MQTRDVAAVAAELLQAQDRRFNESQAQFRAELETREARFNADLEKIAPKKAKSKTLSLQAEGYLMLARKCWAWLYHDA